MEVTMTRLERIKSEVKHYLSVNPPRTPVATFYLRMMVLGQQAVTEARASLFLMGLHREATARVVLSPLEPKSREEWLSSFHGLLRV
jgi:hypothetical protein